MLPLQAGPRQRAVNPFRRMNVSVPCAFIAADASVLKVEGGAKRRRCWSGRRQRRLTSGDPRRPGHQGPLIVQQTLPATVHRLRSHSEYLTPRPGPEGTAC